MNFFAISLLVHLFLFISLIISFESQHINIQNVQNINIQDSKHVNADIVWFTPDKKIILKKESSAIEKTKEKNYNKLLANYIFNGFNSNLKNKLPKKSYLLISLDEKGYIIDFDFFPRKQKFFLKELKNILSDLEPYPKPPESLQKEGVAKFLIPLIYKTDSQ